MPAGSGGQRNTSASACDGAFNRSGQVFTQGAAGLERMTALEAECERLTAIGARRVHRFEPDPPTSGGFIVMQDPEGTEFRVD
jgi:Glyoxalase-like domain